MKQPLLAIFTSATKSFGASFLFRTPHGITSRQRHTWCALSSGDFSSIPRSDSQFEPIPDDLSCWTYVDSTNLRLNWDERLNHCTSRNSTTKTRIPFSSQRGAYTCYLPYVLEILKSLWSLDQNPIWLLVDDLVATGEPNNSSDKCPDFPQWKHIIVSSCYTEVISTLVAQGHIHEPDYTNDGEDVLGYTRAAPVPTWVVMFILATMVNTRAAAYEGLAFCLSQLDNAPRRLRAPLLLLSMCSLSVHGLSVQVPILLGSFHDVFSHNQVTLNLQGNIDHSQSLGSRETVKYQYNVLLTLLSQFPHVPGFTPRIVQFLHHMEVCGLPIETDTANQLIAARFASEQLARTVRDIVERQAINNATYHDMDQVTDLSASLTRFYSKRYKSEAAMYAEASRRIDPRKHAQAYLRSFRDVAASLAYLRTIEEGEHTDHTMVTFASSREVTLGGVGDITSSNERARTPSSKSVSSGVPKRHIYTSLLHSAAVSTTISATTFRDLFNSIRGAHGDDKVLETVALAGMLKRKAWDEAKDLWAQWQATNRSLESQLLETRGYFSKREEVFGDARKVRQALGWSKLKEYLVWRRLKKMKVDAIALSVAVRALAGPEPVSLSRAFNVMDDFAMKVKWNQASLSGAANSSDLRLPHVTIRGEQISDRLENVRLTPRVINCFMARAMYFRRPDVVFRLWDGMTARYGVDSSVATLDILLRSARLAASIESTLSKFIPQWMKRGFSRDFLQGKVVFPDLSTEIRWMLGPDCSPDMSWDGAPPWRVARRVFREEIIFANWPSLRQVDVPALAVRGDEATGRMEALKELTTDRGLWGTKVREMGNYPHLVPSPRTFREYVLLLGQVQRSSEIPEVLAWMKALNIRPSKKTLSIALALWSQVGLDSLVDDVWADATPKLFNNNHNDSGSLRKAEHGGQYGKLICWLEGWIGKESMPDEGEVLMAFRYIRQLESREATLY